MGLAGAVAFGGRAAVILPDGTLLGVGGTDGSVGQRQSLLYDPAADTWTPMASETGERGYRSTAVLLPDGRVLSAGDNQMPCADTQEHPRDNGKRVSQTTARSRLYTFSLVHQAAPNLMPTGGLP
jgi:hypothetical protein